MVGYIGGWLIVSTITIGIYKLFELFVGRKERLAMIEKMSNPVTLDYNPEQIKIPILFKQQSSFTALKVGAILMGMGLGLLIGFLIANSQAQYIELVGNQHYERRNQFELVIGASTLFFGGLGAIIAFIIELYLTKKKD